MKTAQVILEQGLESIGRFYSIYRGVVVKNWDPDKHMNRLLVTVPSIQGGITVWALPRHQHGSTGSGFKFMSPKVGDIVYITFEYGDPSKPLWEYHSWGANQIPEILNNPNVTGIVTPEGNIIYLDDYNGDVVVNLEGKFNVYSKGVVNIHSEGKVFLDSSVKVVVNRGGNNGVINIVELTDKLNNLVTEVENLKTSFNGHTHTGVTPGPGACGPTPQQVTKPFSKFKREDYEDTKFVH